MKSKQEIEDYMNDVKSRMKDYNDFNRTVATGSILALEYVLGGMDSQPETEMKINVKYELDKAAYKKFRADMKQLEAEMKLDNNIDVAGEDLEYGDIVHKKTDGKFYKSDVLKNTMSPERNAEITAELERQIRTGELDPKTIGHIPATLKDVCEWWIKMYPSHAAYHKLDKSKWLIDSRFDKIRNHMEKILKSMK